jgi:hypothetical protein
MLTLFIPVSVQADTVAGENTGTYRFHGNVDGAEVSIDGQMMGVIVKGILDVPVSVTGTPYHAYTFQKEGYYNYAGVINSVPAKGQIIHIYVSMSALPLVEYSRVHLLVSPTDADVTWDGTLLGKVPPTGIFIIYNVVPGKHTLMLAKEGYVTLNEVLTVPKNQVMRVPLTLQPVPLGSITVTSVPTGASVFLDGQFRGVTPLTLNDLPAGSHSVTMRGEGFQDVISAVEVTAGSTTMVSETLIPGTPVPGSTRAGMSSLMMVGGLAIAGLLLVFRKP